MQAGWPYNKGHISKKCRNAVNAQSCVSNLKDNPHSRVCFPVKKYKYEGPPLQLTEDFLLHNIFSGKQNFNFVGSKFGDFFSRGGDLSKVCCIQFFEYLDNMVKKASGIGKLLA